MRSLTRTEILYYSTRSRLGVIKKDIKSKQPLNLIKKINMWRLGFKSDKYIVYNLSSNNPKDYTSDLLEAMARFINQPYAEVLNNKVIFEQVYSRYARVPKTFAVISGGQIMELPGNQAEQNKGLDIYSAVNELLDQYNQVVIKPVRGNSGTGVKLVSRTDKGQIVINGHLYLQGEFAVLANDLNDHFISEYIDQACYSKKLYPHANNTMRLLTMVCPESNEPFLAAAVKKIGTDSSAPVDNNSSGGMAARIDMGTGTLSAASKFSGDHVDWFDQHPDSGALIKGLVIPNWMNIKNEILGVAKIIPSIKYVGWDVVDLEDGLVILEGNNQPLCRVLQIHQPLLKDPRVASFYRFHGLL